MQENRKRKSTVPMGVFSQAADPCLDQPNEQQEAVDQDINPMISDAPEKRAVLDPSHNQSKSEHEAADSRILVEGDATPLEEDHSISDIGSDERVEDPKSDETRDPTSDLTSATDLRDPSAGVEGDPLKDIADKMDKFAVRVSNLSSEGEGRNPGFGRRDARGEKRHTTDVAADLGNTMKALFDNRRDSEWEDFIRENDEADTADQRAAKKSSASDDAVEVGGGQSARTPDPVKIPTDKSAIAGPLIVIEPSGTDPITSLAPLETKNTASRFPLIRGGVAAAATAIVLLVTTTWVVIESRRNQSTIQHSDRSTSVAKSMGQAEDLSSVAAPIARPNPRVEQGSVGIADSKNLEQKSDRPIETKANPLNRRSTRTARSNRRNESQTHIEPAAATESALSEESEPGDASQQSIVELEALPQTPSRNAIITSLTSLRSQVRQCVENKAGVAELDIRIKGSGRVSHVVVQGDFRGTKQGSCIARIVRKARFEPFRQPEFRVLFPYVF